MNWTIFWQSLGVCLASAGTTLSLVGIFASVITAEFFDHHGLKLLVICALAVIACICIALIIGLIQEMAIPVLLFVGIVVFCICGVRNG